MQEAENIALARRENSAKTQDAAYLSAMEVIDSTLKTAQDLTALMEKTTGGVMTDEQMMLVKQPPNLKTDLRDYQLKGYRWISRKLFLGASVILGDEMGLGE